MSQMGARSTGSRQQACRKRLLVVVTMKHLFPCEGAAPSLARLYLRMAVEYGLPILPEFEIQLPILLEYALCRSWRLPILPESENRTQRRLPILPESENLAVARASTGRPYRGRRGWGDGLDSGVGRRGDGGCRFCRCG